LEFSIKTHIAVTGADLTVYINNEKRSLGVSILIAKGDRLTFSPIKAGWRGYIAVKNGFLSQVSLKSQSQYKGITVSTQIKKGELLLVKAARSVVRVDSLEMPGAKSFHSSTIEVYKGPEFEMLSQEIQKQLLLDVFTISSSSNRMATILNEQISGVIPEIITAPVQPGTVQLTPSGKLLILMRDAQTSGGYARVFQGAENAINLVAQKRPNETMTFKLIE
jgi:allophanate hydrolase subunit 2